VHDEGRVLEYLPDRRKKHRDDDPGSERGFIPHQQPHNPVHHDAMDDVTGWVPVKKVLRDFRVDKATMPELEVAAITDQRVPHCMSDGPDNYHRPEHNHNERGKADYPIV
jgi:hypothetical protein